MSSNTMQEGWNSHVNVKWITCQQHTKQTCSCCCKVSPRADVELKGTFFFQVRSGQMFHHSNQHCPPALVFLSNQLPGWLLSFIHHSWQYCQCPLVLLEWNCNNLLELVWLQVKELSFNLNVIYQSITLNSPGYFMSIFSLLHDSFSATPYWKNINYTRPEPKKPQSQHLDAQWFIFTWPGTLTLLNGLAHNPLVAP